RIPFRSLFSLVGAASVLPNMILLLSTVFSPMDKSLRAFQFFALLLVAVWVASLLFSMVAAYGSYFTMGGLVLTVVFVFLAFVSMRAIWVWYLTGDFKFTLYLPLNVFFSGY
ncbi:MAG: hypothetical protein IKM59_01570, partial [Oscillospiraceae bacterium]|nr:hypothetical protein [Oscillospiraceae bacterium]